MERRVVSGKQEQGGRLSFVWIASVRPRQREKVDTETDAKKGRENKRENKKKKVVGINKSVCCEKKQENKKKRFSE